VVHTGGGRASFHGSAGHAIVRGGANHNLPGHAFASHGNTFRGTRGAPGGWGGGYTGWNGGWNGGRYGGWNRLGYFFNYPGLWGYPGWGLAYPYYDYYYPYADYGYGQDVVPPAGYYGGIAADNAVPVPQVADVSGHVDVVVPDPNAVLWFNGYQTSTTGTTRHFDTPALQPGRDYTYTVKATWLQGGQPTSAERVVHLTAGSRRVVDFTQMLPLPTIIQ